MRILTISNLYPPHYDGGYELGCKNIMDELARRGHEIEVVTSTHGIPGCIPATTDSEEYRVHRMLKWIPWECVALSRSETQLFLDEMIQNRSLKKVVKRFSPHIIYIWNMGGLSKSLLSTLSNCNIPTAYYVSDLWMVRELHSDCWLNIWWKKNIKRRLLMKCLLRPSSIIHRVPTKLVDIFKKGCFQFCSKFIKEATLKDRDLRDRAKVIHWGIPIEKFPFESQKTELKRRYKILFTGYLGEHKGVDTAIKALSILVKEFGHGDLILSIVGFGNDEYKTYLEKLVKDSNLDEKVSFLGKIDKEDMYEQVYKENHILMFPSAWEEPFSITLLEAMASGLVVVSTTTGGSAEIIRDDVNSLSFPAGDAYQCAVQIDRIIKSPDLAKSLILTARKEVENTYTLKRQVDMIEEDLRGIIER